jgi:hypothetical protein
VNSDMRHPPNPDILIQEIARDPYSVLQGRSVAAESLAKMGRAGVGAIMATLDVGLHTEADARDVFDAFGTVFRIVAEEDPSAILDFARDDDDPNLGLFVWALSGAAKNRRERNLPTDEITERLRQLQNHRDEWVRRSARAADVEGDAQ